MGRHSNTTIEICKTYALTLSGKCMSRNYINSREIMQWQCKKKHTWKTSWSSIKYAKTWCPVCSKKSKPLIQECIDFAIAEHEGNCLSVSYVNSKENLHWMCREGHYFESTWKDNRGEYVYR